METVIEVGNDEMANVLRQAGIGALPIKRSFSLVQTAQGHIFLNGQVIEKPGVSDIQFILYAVKDWLMAEPA